MSTDHPTPPPAPEPTPEVAPTAAAPSVPPPVHPDYTQAAQQQTYVQPAQYAPRTVRPPLTKRAKTGAAWAGIVGFNLMTLGFFVFIGPLLLLALGSFVLWIVESARQQGSAEIGPEVIRALENFDPSAWVVPLLIISAVGLVIWIIALIISKAILRSSGAVKPWGITWAAAGIAIVAYWLISTIVSFFWGFISMLISSVAQTAGDRMTVSLITGIISFVLVIVINSIIGWLTWLWMAHAMRPTEQQLATQE